MSSFLPFLVAPLALGIESDCANNFDDDCDGLTDLADPDCILEGACCTDGPGTQSVCVELTGTDCQAVGGLYLGDGTLCAGVLDCEALTVTIDQLSATATQDGVLVSWSTAMEHDTVGFRVLRETGGREKGRVAVSGLIPASGNGLQGASYEFLDATRMGAGARYWIEDIDRYGRTTLHGPVAVDAGVRSQGRVAADPS